MDREQALEELRGRLKNKDLVIHSLAVEAIMRELAEFYEEDVDRWGLAGLLHDIDYEKTKNDPANHGSLGAEILENLGVEDSIVYTVKALNDSLGIERKRKMDKVLYSANAAAKVIIEAAKKSFAKKLDSVTLELIFENLNDITFKQGIDRRHLELCIKTGISLEGFLLLSLNAMKRAAGVLEF